VKAVECGGGGGRREWNQRVGGHSSDTAPPAGGTAPPLLLNLSPPPRISPSRSAARSCCSCSALDLVSCNCCDICDMLVEDNLTGAFNPRPPFRDVSGLWMRLFGNRAAETRSRVAVYTRHQLLIWRIGARDAQQAAAQAAMPTSHAFQAACVGGARVTEGVLHHLRTLSNRAGRRATNGGAHVSAPEARRPAPDKTVRCFANLSDAQRRDQPEEFNVDS